MRVDIDLLKREIAALLIEHPELNNDIDALDMSLSSETNLDEVLNELARRYKDATCFAKALAAEIKDSNERKTRFELQAMAVKRLAAAALNAAGVRKRAVPLATFYTSDAPPKLIGDVDPKELPARFQRVSVEANKTEIKMAIEAGETIDGYMLSAGEPIMNVRVK